MISSYSNILMINQERPTSENLGVGMYSSLMDTFDFPAPINYIESTSIENNDSIFGDFFAIYNRTNRWILPTHDEPMVPLYMT